MAEDDFVILARINRRAGWLARRVEGAMYMAVLERDHGENAIVRPSAAELERAVEAACVTISAPSVLPAVTDRMST